VSGRIHNRLTELGLTLPEPFLSKAGNYVPFVNAGGLLFIAGQGPMEGDKAKYTGKVGTGISPEKAHEAARLTALNIIAQANKALDGDLDRIVRCIRLFGLVSSGPHFTGQAQVMNGASDLMVEVFGEAGRHARSTIGSPGLPHDMTIEIEALFAIA
jgi:enamine deaminase RidA (YjgF/YER057c/UK114 family)